MRHAAPLNRVTSALTHLLAVSFTLLSSAALYADNNQVITVPFSQQNPNLPHPAHEGARITLKGIIRSASCGSYRVSWDIDRDGDFNDEYMFTASRNGTTSTVYDIGRTFEVPYVDRARPLNINVRVECGGAGGAASYGTFKLFVYNFGTDTGRIQDNSERLYGDPERWTDEQFEVMTSMAIQEAMWHTHRNMGGYSHNNHAIEAHAGYAESTGIAQWLFVINNHLPAYPPGSVGAGDASAEWRAINATRWNSDPYAESAMRLLNYNVARGGATGVSGADESNNCGYNSRSGNAESCNRIANTNDSAGIYARSSNVYRTGMNTGAIATVLPALSGTKVRVGPGAGYPWEWYVQQLVDYLGYQQRDTGCANGGWFYDTRSHSSGDCRYSDLSTTQWAYIGLESAEVAGRPYGVFVNNRHKYRIANNLISNIQGDNGAAYDNRRHGRSDFKLTGGQLLGARWLNTHNMNKSSNARPFPDESGHSLSTLRDNHDRYYGYIQHWFTRRRVHGTHWLDGLWRHGDYRCGDTSSLYNVSDQCGNTYSLYSHQKAYHTGLPALHHVGNYDWYKMFASYYIRAQYRYANNSNGRTNYGSVGQINDDYCDIHSVTCYYGSGQMSTIMGGLVMTPAVFNPKPIPIGSLAPILPGQQPVANVTVTEGCIPGQGRVTVTHQESFHPNSDSQIRTYMWDMDASNGLWWENNPLRPDLDVNGDVMSTSDRFENLTYAYQEARNQDYIVTLRVEDNSNQYKQIRVGTVRVNAGQDVPPSVATGGPYVIDVDDALRLRASATDGNEDCGDQLTVDWDLDNNGSYEISGADATVNWTNAGLGSLPKNQPFNIKVRVRDSFGAVDTVVETTTLSIYDKEPIAVTRANPSEAACRQNITFDGSGSYHNNPQRTIASYQWTVDGRTSDRSIFTTSFDSYGTRTAVLTIQDDLGHESQAQVDVNVNLGNLPPIVRVVSDQITLMSNEALSLNASQSSDPNSDCGDSVQQIGWYLHRPGVTPNVNGAPDFTGGSVTIAIADWQAAMGWPGNDQLVATVAVRDSFGAVSTKEVQVTGVRAEPITVIRQVPNPSAYRVSDGSSSARIDGRESYSLLEGVTITRYEWDIDCDGSYEREAGQFLYEKAFPPNTAPENLPPVRMCLRVTDSNGNSANSEPYTVQYQPLGNTAPYADADPSDAPELGYHILVGQLLTLDGSSSFDPDAEDFDDEIASYTWTLNGISNASLTRSNADPNPAELELSAAQLASLGVSELGSYDLSLVVRDLAGNSGTDDSSLTIHKEVSDLIVVINPTNASPNTRVTFDASRSEHSHPDIDVTQVVWFFGELEVSGPLCDSDADCNVGYCITNPDTSALTCMSASLGTQEGPIVNQSFDQITPEPGDSVGVTVVVRDSNGGQVQSGLDDELGFEIRVDQGNRLPQANAGGGTPIGSDEVVGAYTVVFVDPASPSYNPADPVLSLDGSRSAEPDAQYGDAIVSYTWGLGSCTCSSDQSQHGSCPIGSSQVGATLPTLTRAQLSQCGIGAQGSYDISLTVTDRFGDSATSQTQLNIIGGLQALAQALPNRTSCEQQVTFDGRGSVISGPADQGYNIVEYSWDLDGDGSADFSNPSFTTPVTALPQNGQVQVVARLTVTNALGAALIAQGRDPGPHRATDDVNVVINVQELAPTANPGGPYRTGGDGNGFAPVTVDGRASSDPNAPCDGIAEYWWDTDGDGLYGPEDNNVDGQGSDYTGPIITFSSSSWRANTTANIGLKVKDYFGQLSAPTIGDIVVTDVIPPSGEVVSPRAGQCAAETAQDSSVARVTVRHPASNPQAVRVDIKLGANVVGTTTVQSNQLSNPAREATVNVPLNLAGVEEGEYNVVAVFTLVGNNSATTQATSGGAVSFDFTPPLITIGAQPTEAVCYANGRVPEAEVEVVDNFDDAPQVSQSVVEDGCVRTLTVTARDRCGQESSAERSYRVALPVTANLIGITEGELQGQARASWALNGPAECSNGISAEISRDGQAFGPYGQDSLISTPGAYRLRLNVLNCLGVAREQVTSFRINRPPVAVALPEGHPNADPEVENGYIIAEGSALTLDGTLSLAPEEEDRVASYLWTIPGQAPLTGPRPVASTQEDGVFSGSLEVTDNFGDSHTETFTITVTDIDPIPHGGGPYVANQDVDLMFDASASRVISPADPISSVDWDWGDGTRTLGVPVNVPQAHSYSAQGAYNVRLTVHDEDSSAEVVVGVIIADVDPEINAIFVDEVMGEQNTERPDPVVAFESVPLTFGVDATPGAENDPITLYQWDFDGDNIFDVTTDVPYASWQFMEPQVYNVGVLVRDRDSFTFRSQLVDVKPVDFETTLTFVRNSVQERIDSGALNPINRLRLSKTVASANAGIWGQRRDELSSDAELELEVGADASRAARAHLQMQGISFSAAQRVLSDLVQAQTAGEDFGTEIWSLSRQLRRETAYDLAALKADTGELYSDRFGTPDYSRHISNAEGYEESAGALYSSEGFEPDARRVPNTEGLSLTLQNDARRALDWMNVAVDQCADPRFGFFRVQAPEVPVSAYFEEAEEVRALAHEALSEMLAEMNRYVAIDIQDPGPARDEIIAAARSLEDIVDRAALSIDPECFTLAGQGRQDCSDNLNALEIELEAMDLIEALRNANSKGAYVMHWQSCLVQYLRFRIKASIAAVRSQCGLLSPYYLKSTEVFSEGDALLSEQDDIIGALNFYTDTAQRCFILDVYNECLARVDNVAPYDYPEVCLE